MVAPIGFPQNYLLDSGVQFASFDSLTGYTLSAAGSSAGSVYEIDPNGKEGAGCLKVTTPIGTGTTFAQFKTPNAVINCNGRLGFWFQVDNVANLNKISVFFTQDTAFTDFWLPEIQFNIALTFDQMKFNGWRWIEFAPAAAGAEFSWGAAGGGAPTFPHTYTNLQIRVYAQNGVTATVRFDDARCDPRQRAKLLITADDGILSWHNLGIPELDSRGLKHTWDIFASTIGTGGNPTVAQVNTVYANGHDIGVHGDTDLSSLTAQQAYDDVMLNRKFLFQNGWTRAVNFYTWPNGVYQTAQGSPTLYSMIQQMGFNFARGTARSMFAKAPFGLADRAFDMPVIGWQATDTVANMLAKIDAAILTGGIIFLMFHAVVAAAPAGSDILTTDLQSLLNGINIRKNRGVLDVVTASQLISGLTVPTVL